MGSRVGGRKGGREGGRERKRVGAKARAIYIEKKRTRKREIR